jgi:hypothetical protein
MVFATSSLFHLRDFRQHVAFLGGRLVATTAVRLES